MTWAGVGTTHAWARGGDAAGVWGAEGVQSAICGLQSSICNPQSSIQNSRSQIPNPLLTSGFGMRYSSLTHQELRWKGQEWRRQATKGATGEKPMPRNLRIVLTSNGALVYNFNMVVIRGGFRWPNHPLQERDRPRGDACPASHPPQRRQKSYAPPRRRAEQKGVDSEK